MSSRQQPWIVLKFGGTSVSTAANWANIVSVVQARLATGARVLVVHSAVSGITDRLEKLLVAALAGAHEPLLALIEQRHRADERGLRSHAGPGTRHRRAHGHGNRRALSAVARHHGALVGCAQRPHRRAAR